MLTKDEIALVNRFQQSTDEAKAQLSQEELNHINNLVDQLAHDGSPYAEIPEGAAATTLKTLGAAAAGAASGALYGLPESPYVPEEISEYFGELQKEYPVAYPIGKMAGRFGSPANRIGAGAGILRTGLQAAGQTVAEAAIAGKDSKEIAREAKVSAVAGTAFGAAGKAVGLGADYLKAISGWNPEAMKKAYEVSKATGMNVNDPTFGMMVRGQIINKTNKLKDFLDTKRQELATALENRTNEIKKVKSVQIDGKRTSVSRELQKLIGKQISSLQTTRNSLIQDFNNEKESAKNFYNDIKSAVLYKEPGKAKEFEQTLSELKTQMQKGMSPEETSILTGSKQFFEPEARPEPNVIRDYFNDAIKELKKNYLRKDVDLNDLYNFKRDLQAYLKYDKIKLKNVGTIDLSSTKKFKSPAIENNLQSFEHDLRGLLYKLDRAVPSKMATRPLEDVSEDYHTVSKMIEKTPTISQFVGESDPTRLAADLENTIMFKDLLRKEFPEISGEFTRDIDELASLRELHKITSGVSLPTSGQLKSYPSVVRAASLTGTKVKGFKEEHPIISTVAKKAAMIGAPLKPQAPLATAGSLVGQQMPPEIMDQTMEAIIPEAQAGEMQMGKMLPRSVPAVIRNKQAVLEGLGMIDPIAAVNLDNAIHNNDAKGIETMIGTFAKDPRISTVFEPTPVITSRGALHSAVMTGDGKARIVDDFDQQAIRRDFLDDDSLSYTEKAKRLNQLHKEGTINLQPQQARPVEQITMPPIYVEGTFQGGTNE